MKSVYKAPQWKIDKLDDTIVDCETIDENILKMIDVNEISTKKSSPIIAAVERCLSQAVKNPREAWYQDYTVPDTYDKDTGIRRVEKVKFQVDKY